MQDFLMIVSHSHLLTVSSIWGSARQPARTGVRVAISSRVGICSRKEGEKR
jgi:hypothetical protein